METRVRIKVIGLGGSGVNSVNRMIDRHVEGIDFLVVDTDREDLLRSRAPITIQIGEKLTEGAGSVKIPDVGRAAAFENKKDLLLALNETDVLFIVTGLGGGTGTGAAPVIAKLAKDLNIFTIAVVTTPLLAEEGRLTVAEAGVLTLRKHANSIFIIDTETLFRSIDGVRTSQDVFEMVDELLCITIRSITDTISVPGLINPELADLKAIMSGSSMLAVGFGGGMGKDRAQDAARQVLTSPFLEKDTVTQAKGALIHVIGDADLTLQEVEEANSIIREALPDVSNILLGASVDASLSDRINVTLLLTGVERAADSGTSARREDEGTSQMQGGILADALIVWDPEIVDPDDYVSLVTALGDLVRSQGGIGVERIGHLEVDIPIWEGLLV
jgi:cell division protein FtsZ